MKGKWTSAESKLLRELQKPHVNKWKRISVDLGRSPSDCASRWHMIEKYEGGHLSGEWRKEEEERLKSAVEQIGVPRWNLIAESVGTRSNNNCRFHWQVLDYREKDS